MHRFSGGSALVEKINRATQNSHIKMCLDDQMLLKALRWHLVAQVGWQGASLLTLCCFISPFFLILSLLVFKIRNQIHLRLQLGYTSWVANLSLWGKKVLWDIECNSFFLRKINIRKFWKFCLIISMKYSNVTATCVIYNHKHIRGMPSLPARQAAEGAGQWRGASWEGLQLGWRSRNSPFPVSAGRPC